MTVRRRVLRVAPEFALAVVAAACLSVVALQGFVVDPRLQFNAAAVAGLSCVCQAVLFALGPRRHGAAWAALAYVVLSAAVVGVGMVTSEVAGPLADVEGSHLAFCMVLLMANAAVHVLSRRPASFVTLIAIALFTCAFVQYVYHADLVAPSLGAVGALAALWVARTYARGAACADGQGETAYGAAALTAVAATLLALAVGGAVYVLVVAPLNPGHLTVKLFTQYRSLETVQVSNPSEVVTEEDPDARTVTLTDEQVWGSIPEQLDADDPALAELGDFVQDSREQSGSKSLFKLEPVDEGGVYLYTYELPEYWWLLLLALPFVLVALAVAVRKALRARRRAHMRALSARDQVGALFTRLVRDFGVLGTPMPCGQTPAEYARDAAAQLACFAQDGVDWQGVTALYERCHYGADEPTGEELAACWRLYDGHFARAAQVKGRIRYCFKYFWLI